MVVQKPTRVLVTGADGRIGRAVSETLTARGIRVTALSLRYGRPVVADRVLTGDAMNEADVSEALDGADAVVHLAAIPHRDAGKPYEIYRTNVNSTFNVLAQCGQRGIRRAVIASSINAFGVPMNLHDVAPAYFPIDEDIPADIADWYSLSKRADELTAQKVARRWGIDVVALRFPFVETAERSRRASERLQADPMSGMREGWSYLDLRDAGEAVYLALVAPVSGAIVIGLSAADTLLAVPAADLVARYAHAVPVRGELTATGALIDTTRAKQVLGFHPRYSIHHQATDDADARKGTGRADA